MNRFRIDTFFYTIFFLIFVNSAFLSAGNITQVNSYLLWDAVPQIIPSTDAAGICYSSDLGHLLISDSEINEDSYWNNENIFDCNFRGDILYTTYVTNASSLEPTGIVYNEFDGYYYITNDNTKRLYQYSLISGSFVKQQSWSLSISGIGSIDDPEGVTANPNDGHLFIADGNLGAKLIVEVSISGTTLTYVNHFLVGDNISDPEGVAFYDPIDHLFIVSSPDDKVYEYDLSGNYVDQYSLASLTPNTVAPQGIGFGPSSENASLISLYIADGGRDNGQGGDFADGWIYEVRFPDIPLPVELLAFNAEAVGSHVVLTWSTASEFENLYWIIERKTANNEFEEIGRVDGRGTTPVGADYIFYDENVIAGETYYYRITDVALNGEITRHAAVEVYVPLPTAFGLEQNYPNPFNPKTTIIYTVPTTADVMLTVYNLLGQQVATLVDETKPAGRYSIDWSGRNKNGSPVASGVYIYRLRSRLDNGDIKQVAKRMILRR